jgi:hypothetical protein
MSFLECIQRAVDAGSTDRQRAQATQEAWQAQSDAYARFMGRREAEEKAYEDIRDAFRRDTAIKRHQRLRDLEVMRRNIEDMDATADVARAIRFPIERTEGAADQPDSVWFTMKALEQQFQGMMGSFFSAINRDILGNVKQRAKLQNVVREMHGESTGDATARAMSEAIQKTFERARFLFNEAGGHISKLDDWGIPHVHDRKRIADTPVEQWIDTTIGRLDWDRIENFATGRPFGAAAPDAVKRGFLREIYGNIVDGDVPKAKPRYGPAPGSGKTGDAFAHQRVLHFKSADDWMAYNDQFGASDMFGAITSHMHKMARDIALMRSFGTNPRMGLEHRIQVALQKAKGDEAMKAKVRRSADLARAMMDQVTGNAAVPVNEFWGNFFSGVRMWTTASYLGSAMLSSGGDWAAMRMAARAVGMNPGNVLSRHVSLMASAVDRETAAQLGYIADTLTDSGNTIARFLGDVPANEILERLTSFVMRAQGLSYWTDMGRTAFRMEFTGLYARNAGRALKDVDPDLRQILEARGVTEADWRAFSDPQYLFTAPNGAKFLSPTHWMHQVADAMDPIEAERIALRMGSIIEEQVEFAIPTMSVEARAFVQRGARPGTILGEAALSGLSFKSFAMSVWVNQIRRILAQPTGASRARYAAEMLASFTAMGAVAVQLKELSKGNDPRPMDSTAFWGAAFLQGGGAGIVGDLLSASESRVGGGLPGYLLGPVIGLGNQVGELTIGNVMEVARGEETNAGRELSKFVSSNTPVLSSLWQIRAATDRMMFDQLQLLLDPEAEQSLRTQAQNRMRNYGNASWWSGGEMLPSRAPDLGAALGQ